MKNLQLLRSYEECQCILVVQTRTWSDTTLNAAQIFDQRRALYGGSRSFTLTFERNTQYRFAAIATFLSINEWTPRYATWHIA